MKFIYKIYSGADGFTPAEIPNRLWRGGLLLRWARYLESVSVGDEVWIYFRGPRVDAAGVYAKGSIRFVDTARRKVRVRLTRYRTDRPLTDQAITDYLERIVTTSRLQVFILPSLRNRDSCVIEGEDGTCRKRMCQSCPTWNQLHLIGPRSHDWPARMPALDGFAPAYWVLPRRGFLHQEGYDISRSAERTSDLFYRFKMGEAELAYPLALGMARALEIRNLINFDCIVPVPLSPAKAKAGEIHRTRRLARELSLLIDVPVRELLSLKWSVSKSKVRIHQGKSAHKFEQRYLSALSAKRTLRNHNRVLVIDDVATEGSTLKCAFDVIRSVNPDCQVFAATAGLMAVKAVVRRQAALVH